MDNELLFERIHAMESGRLSVGGDRSNEPPGIELLGKAIRHGAGVPDLRSGTIGCLRVATPICACNERRGSPPGATGPML